MKRIGLKFMLYFDPLVTRWTTMSDFESWLAKHLAMNNMEANRIEVLGSPELVMVISSKVQLDTQPKMNKGKSVNIQTENLKKGIK